PGSGGRNGIGPVDAGSRLGDVGDQLLAGQLLAQQGLVADDDPLDVVAAIDHLHQAIELGAVGGEVVAEPGTDGDLDAVTRGDGGDLAEHPRHRIGADAPGVAGEQGHVLLDLRHRRVGAIEGALAGAGGGIGKAADVIRDGGQFLRAVEQSPAPQGDGGQAENDKNDVEQTVEGTDRIGDVGHTSPAGLGLPSGGYLKPKPPPATQRQAPGGAAKPRAKQCLPVVAGQDLPREGPKKPRGTAVGVFGPLKREYQNGISSSKSPKPPESAAGAAFWAGADEGWAARPWGW